MSVKIVTDSTVDLEPDVIRALGIGIVPIYVRFGDRVYRDGVDISKADFYQLLKTSTLHPATSQPPPEDFARYYADSLNTTDHVISIHVSSRISGTYNSASLARNSMGQPGAIDVVDSRFNSAGLGLIVKEAALMAQQGAGAPEILAEVQSSIGKVHMFGVFETMKYLARSGRVSKTIAAAARVLNVMPLLTFHNGEIVRAGLVRTINKGVDRIHEFVRARLPAREIIIVHSNIPEQAQELKRRLSGLVKAEIISITELGAALGVHGGPGVLLVGVRTEN
uniref:DegV domain-containing protein/M5005_Spy1226 n=1 Tax=uncultured Dehalococcoidia bacterium TaxID=498747 RepID=A0A871XZ93_9CHLR|nr:DegV domain-containing protein/M5005_Spy1226 [uncultured Dehalococcoidia bacterium]